MNSKEGKKAQKKRKINRQREERDRDEPYMIYRQE